MYKNWLQKKIAKRKEGEELWEKIEEDFSKYTEEDFNNLKKAEVDLVAELNPNYEKWEAAENEKFEQLLNGTFWKLNHPDFEELLVGNIEKKGKEILELIKPFYRKDLVKAYKYNPILISIAKELKPNLSIDKTQYRIEIDNRSVTGKDIIINCDYNNIWYKEKADKAAEKIKNATEQGHYEKFGPSPLAAYNNEFCVSLKELYEEKVEKGLNVKELRRMVKKNDFLDHLLFLYIIKRAQRQDITAADLLFKMYEEATEIKGTLWIKGIEERRGIKFNPKGELGAENVKIMSKFFLKMLITGDDPESLFKYIKYLADNRNIEMFLTRKLRSKVKKIVKHYKKKINETIEEYKQLSSVKPYFQIMLNKEIEPFELADRESFFRKQTAALKTGNNPKPNRATTYREFINTQKLTARLQELTEIYYDAEDNYIRMKLGSWVSLDEVMFNQFTKEEKKLFETIREKAERKAKANETSFWHTYRDFLDEDELNENEKKIYEVYKRYETLLHTAYFPYLELLKENLLAHSNPYTWFDKGWFNNKTYTASKNNNFTNWLFQSNKWKPGALEGVLNNWMKSKYFMKDTKKRHIKDEFLVTYKEQTDETVKSNTNKISIDEMKVLTQKIKNYVKENKFKQQYVPIIQICFEKHLKMNTCTYEEIGKEFDLSRRQIIRIWKAFYDWVIS